MDPERRTPQTLQTVDRALTVLEAVATAEAAPTSRDLAARLELNVTTVYHLVNTLTGRGYLHRDAAGRLHLGAALNNLYARFREATPFLREVHEVLEQLVADAGETAWYSQLENGQVIVRGLVEGSRALKVGGLYLGLAGNEHRRASGRAILPHLDAAERDAILARSTASLPRGERVSALEEFEEQAALTLERGWSVDDQGSDEGIMSLGAPVFGPGGRVVGAVGMVGPESRMRDGLGSRVRTLLDAASMLTARRR